MKPQLQLSASTLSMLRGDNPCPRCFYDHVALKIERPRGAFPSLPGGLDREVKFELDGCRRAGTVPNGLRQALPSGAKLWGTPEQIRPLRHWKSGLVAKVGGASVIGGLDDLVVSYDDQVAAVDVKSKGAEPKPEDVRWYHTQMDVYGLLLGQNVGRVGAKALGVGYLWYWWPADVETKGHEPGTHLCWWNKVLAIDSEPARAEALVYEALDLLASQRPPYTKGCEFCDYRRAE